MNLVDLLTAKPEDIVNGRFEYRRDKTHKLYSIKIEKEAMDIIEKYRGKDYLLSPMERYTNHKNYMQHMNRALQKIGLHYTTSQEKKGQALFPDITTYCRGIHGRPWHPLWTFPWSSLAGRWGTPG